MIKLYSDRETKVNNQTFRINIQRKIGLNPIQETDARCPFCKNLNNFVDCKGEHALVCPHIGKASHHGELKTAMRSIALRTLTNNLSE